MAKRNKLLSPRLELAKKIKLPSPRLELRWIKIGEDWKKSECLYFLVLPLGEHDVRREDVEGNIVYDENFIELGRTQVISGNGSASIADNGDIEIPYRDGAHAKWDSKALGIFRLLSSVKIITS